MSAKIALITGASRGLGASMAKHLAAAGVDIVGTYVKDRTAAEAVASEVRRLGARAVVLQLDLSAKAHIDAFAAALPDALRKAFARPAFDYLINNAGIGIHAPFSQTTEAQFDEIMALQVKAPFFLTQALLPSIVDGGRILNVSSGLARFTLPGYSAYAAAKGAIEILTRYMAKELGERRISVNVIAPGAIETDFGGGAVRDNADLNRMIAAATALGRVGLPDDVGSAVAALLSDTNGWINGTRIEVSGGQNL